MSEERIEQILDAYTRCVARYGIEGTTLQLVADEAGMVRGNVRHYVGNRDDLRKLFGKRMTARYAHGAQQVATAGPAGKQAETLVRHWFKERVATDDDAAIDALFAAARYDEGLRKGLRAVYLGMESLVAASLHADFPARAPGVYEDAAFQIIALAYGYWTFSEIGFPAPRASSALRGALQIIEGVAESVVQRS